VSTVREIEAAAERLPVEQKEELFRFLAMKLRGERRPTPYRIYSQEELAAMLAEDEADGRDLRQNR